MDLTFLIGLASGMVLVTTLVGCLRCRWKSDESETQQKYSKKVRKRHMIPKSCRPSNQVDYVRKVSECRSPNSSPPAKVAEKASIKPPVVYVEAPSDECSSSVFDDSFRTETQSSSDSVGTCVSAPGRLTMPARIPTYLSLQQDSCVCLTHACSSDSVASQITGHGETNPGFADSSIDSRESAIISDRYDTIDSSCDINTEIKEVKPNLPPRCDTKGRPIVSPRCDQEVGPFVPHQSATKMTEVKPSFRLPQTTTETSAYFKSDIFLPEIPPRRLVNKNIELIKFGSFRRHSDIGVRGCRDIEEQHDLFDRSFGEPTTFWDENEALRENNLQKVLMEGTTHYNNDNSNNNRRHSYDSMSLHEKLRRAKLEDSMCKGLHKNKLVMPPRFQAFRGATVGVCSPSRRTARLSTLSSINSAGQSDHTYESITSELAGEMSRRDSAEIVVNDLNKLSINTNTNPLMSTPTRRGSYVDVDHSGNSSQNHTYESIPSENRNIRANTPNSDGTVSDNSVVIIGRRVSNPFENKFSKRQINKKKQTGITGPNVKENKIINQSANQFQTGHNSYNHCRLPRDPDDRYSPFPSAKKLAFKSAFKQTLPPRSPFIHTVSDNINPHFCLPNGNIRTPEIKVDNDAQILDNTEFVKLSVKNHDLASLYHDNTFQTQTYDPPLNIVTPELTYNTLKAYDNFKYGMVKGPVEKHVCYKKHLPSLSDHMEEDMVKRGCTDMYSASTPVQLPPVTPAYF